MRKIEKFVEDLDCTFLESSLMVRPTEEIIKDFSDSLHRELSKQDIDNMMSKKTKIGQFEEDSTQITQLQQKIKRIFLFVQVKMKYKLGPDENEINKAIDIFVHQSPVET